MRYIKTFETYRTEPFTNSEIISICHSLYSELNTLGLILTNYSNTYDIGNPKDNIEKKDREILELLTDINWSENSILNVILHGVAFREKLTTQTVAWRTNNKAIPHEVNLENLSLNSVVILNDLNNKHLDLESDIINPQTPKEFHDQYLNKILKSFNKCTDNIIFKSGGKVIHTCNEPLIKKIIIDYITSLIDSPGIIPEYIFKTISENIKYTPNPFQTLSFLKKHEPVIYQSIIKYNSNFITGKQMGDIGF